MLRDCTNIKLPAYEMICLSFEIMVSWLEVSIKNLSLLIYTILSGTAIHFVS